MGSSFLDEISTEEALKTIYRRIKEEYSDDKVGLNFRKDFEYWSNRRWAAYELALRIESSPFIFPTTIVEEFICEMAMYACFGEDVRRTIIFEAAVETGEDLLNVLI